MHTRPFSGIEEKMMVLITYDVNTETEAGKKRLHKVAKQCENYGQRVQNSVFECVIDPARFKQLQAKLVKLIDQEKDSIRYYYLGDEWRSRVEQVGVKTSYDIEGPLVV
jgi:CRISPR-associated protein Cas2